MRDYLYREYSEEELNEIIKNIGSKLSKLNNNYNREYYNNMMEFYVYLVNLKREMMLEKKLKEKIEKSENDYIETDPILKEYEKSMREELEKIESENLEYNDDIY